MKFYVNIYNVNFVFQIHNTALVGCGLMEQEAEFFAVAGENMSRKNIRGNPDTGAVRDSTATTKRSEQKSCTCRHVSSRFSYAQFHT